MKNILYTHVSSSSIHRKNNSRASAEEFDDTGYFTKCLYVATYIVALLVCALVKKIKLVLLKSIHTHIPYTCSTRRYIHEEGCVHNYTNI